MPDPEFVPVAEKAKEIAGVILARDDQDPLDPRVHQLPQG